MSAAKALTGLVVLALSPFAFAGGKECGQQESYWVSPKTGVCERAENTCVAREYQQRGWDEVKSCGKEEQQSPEQQNPEQQNPEQQN